MTQEEMKRAFEVAEGYGKAFTLMDDDSVLLLVRAVKSLKHTRADLDDMERQLHEVAAERDHFYGELVASRAVEARLAKELAEERTPERAP